MENNSANPLKSKMLALFLVNLLLLNLISLNRKNSWASSNSSEGIITSDIAEGDISKPWYEDIDAEWGGHFKLMGSAAWPDNNSYYKPVGTDPNYDGHINLRLKNQFF